MCTMTEGTPKEWGRQNRLLKLATRTRTEVRGSLLRDSSRHAANGHHKCTDEMSAEEGGSVTLLSDGGLVHPMGT